MRKLKPRGISLIFSIIVTILTGVLIYLLVYNATYTKSHDYFFISIALVFCFTYVVTFYFLKYSFKTIYSSLVEDDPNQAFKDYLKSGKLTVLEEKLKTLNERTQKEMDHLIDRENYQKEFIGNLAHELKTPIFNIQGYILTLLEGAIDDPDINVKYLERVEKSVERMIQLLEDLDTMSKFQSNQVKLRLETINLNLLVDDIIEEFNLNIAVADKKIVKAYDREYFISGDKKKIKQVFINLINNALKYGKQNGTITINFKAEKEVVWVEIKDDGPGIAQEHINRIFERFYRIESSRSRDLGGSGLGLAIVKSIIEAHDQEIKVSSRIGHGTTFSFTLSKANN